jgi:hypothetical protein
MKRGEKKNETKQHAQMCGMHSSFVCYEIDIIGRSEEIIMTKKQTSKNEGFLVAWFLVIMDIVL